jgi:hypothetical protein
VGVSSFGLKPQAVLAGAWAGLRPHDSAAVVQVSAILPLVSGPISAMASWRAVRLVPRVLGSTLSQV